ncbi:MAG TPA: Gfo/Idh/MocA family oxidoreductase [Burkholderiaceae bacterium]|nr:Gfo/Idh/MocA family oxidoreductase [Rhodoferax sp.]HQZ06954.1 Gfo/Idh/MocA family oxidoreductase [Burkholderiaceae bacterium]
MPGTPAFDVAVVGAGMGSAPHLRSLQDLRATYPLTWVCARDAQRLAAVPLPDGVRRTTRLDDILQDPRVRAVLVLTPPAAHLDVVRLVAAAGKHVLVEKPLELDLARAQELVACCEAAGVQLAVMLQYRLREAATHLRQLLHSGMLGQLTSASASVRWWRPQSYYDVPGRGTRARDGGGVLMTQAIHTLDLLLDLIGSPQKVSGAVATSAVHQMECEDTASALLHYPGGAVAVLQATTAASPGYPERIEINMTGGTATLESGRLRLTTMDGRTETVGADSGTGGGADPMAFDHGPHRVVIQDFLDAVRDGRPPAVTGRSALAVQRVIEAIMASSAQGRPVALEPGNA